MILVESFEIAGAHFESQVVDHHLFTEKEFLVNIEISIHISTILLHQRSIVHMLLEQPTHPPSGLDYSLQNDFPHLHRGLEMSMPKCLFPSTT